MAFEAVAGQQTVARRLGAALRGGRLSHAYLFVGSAGTGRAATARRLARALLCADRPAPDEACGRCEDCRLFQSGHHPDYREIGLPPGRQFLPIEAVRQAQHAAGLKPVRGRRRVFVIRDAERLSEPAANCFLKTLEEPPGACVFVLLAAGLRTVPPTIVSRCLVLRFANLPPDVLREQLEVDGADPADAAWLARRAWGSPGLAARFREAALHEFNRELLGRLEALSVRGNFELSDWLTEQAAASSAAESRAALQELLECALLYYRDLALAAAAGEAPPDLCNAAVEGESGTPPEAHLRKADLVLEAIEALGANAQRRLALDDLCTQLGLLSEKPT